MNNRGFSIIELVVVIGLVAALLTLATLDFSTWNRKSQVERQVKELYADIQGARLDAAFTKQRRGIEFAAQQVVFKRYSSSNEATTAGTVIATKNLPIAMTRTAWASPADGQIVFDTRGVMSDPIIKVFCVTTTIDAAYDALIITPAITNMGKVTNRGDACGQDNVTQK
jgi:prepilin-type N-terminal cleavage/methylation domain-containing protein